MSKPVRTIHIWKCDVCGTEGQWTADWSVWTSLKADDAGMGIVACSKACQNSCDPAVLMLRKYGKQRRR
ncbi:MAG: hypothetical protein E6Q97_00125 [Desulfurellales bacterium]|nr:MAG: hypothetical protein E6Q97_00125 [Desulfurellales bacterium]